jgi:hypothetical protein
MSSGLVSRLISTIITPLIKSATMIGNVRRRDKVKAVAIAAPIRTKIATNTLHSRTPIHTRTGANVT